MQDDDAIMNTRLETTPGHLILNEWVLSPITKAPSDQCPRGRCETTLLWKGMVAKMVPKMSPQDIIAKLSFQSLSQELTKFGIAFMGYCFGAVVLELHDLNNSPYNTPIGHKIILTNTPYTFAI